MYRDSTIIFSAFDIDGNEVFRGTQKAFNEKFDSNANLYSYTDSNAKVFGLYYIKKLNGKPTQRKPKVKKVKEKAKTETPFDIAIRMLKIYGNTIYKGDKEKFEKEFSDAGMPVIAIPAHFDKGYILTRKEF